MKTTQFYRAENRGKKIITSTNFISKPFFSRPVPRGIIQTILIITAAIGYAALKYKWTKLNQQTIEIEENNSFNNRKENALIMSTGQLMINGIITLITFPSAINL